MNLGTKVLLWSDTWATFALGMIGPIYAIFVEQIGGDILDAGWAYFAFMMTSGIVMYIMSKWENGVRHKEKLVVAGYSLTALGCMSYFFVSDQLGLIITQVILGLAGAVLVPAFDALYSDYVEKKEEAFQWGSYEAMQFVMTALAAVAGAYVASIFGFKALFVFMFGVSLFSVFNSMNLIRKQKFLIGDMASRARVYKKMRK